MAVNEYQLRWNHHQLNFIEVFKNLLELEELTDVTLSAEGKHIKAHKVILSACSPYFKMIFTATTSKHPIVILSEIKFIDLKTIVDFMYLGEINVPDERLADVLESAEYLQVKGLCSSNETKESSVSENCKTPERKRRKKLNLSNENYKMLSNNQTISPIVNVSDSDSVVNVQVDPEWIQMSSQSDNNSDDTCEMQYHNQAENYEVTLNAHYKSQLSGENTNCQPLQTTSNISKRGRKAITRDSVNFSLALEAVRSGQLGFCKAAKFYGVNNRSLWLEYKKRGYPSKVAKNSKQTMECLKSP